MYSSFVDQWRGKLAAGHADETFAAVRGKFEQARAGSDDQLRQLAIAVERLIAVAPPAAREPLVILGETIADELAERRRGTRLAEEAQATATLARRILDVLESDALRPTELAQRLRADRSHVSKALRRLTAEGEIVKGPVPSDGRGALYQRAADPAQILARDLHRLAEVHNVVGRCNWAAIVRVDGKEVGIGSTDEMKRILESGVPASLVEA